MEKCINCIHYKACEDWAKSFCSYEETTFPYEAENNLCEHYEPVVHGEWKLHKDGSGTCNQCGKTAKNIWDYDGWQNYCGNCGARMDGGK